MLYKNKVLNLIISKNVLSNPQVKADKTKKMWELYFFINNTLLKICPSKDYYALE